MAEGLIFRDSDSPENRTTLEYSDEVPPTLPSNWNTVAEMRSITLQGQEAGRIDLTHLGSTTVETARALAELGGVAFVCNWVPTAANGGLSPQNYESHATLVDLWISGQRRWWRWTFPKVDASSANQATFQWDGEVALANPGIGGHTDPFDLNGSITIRGSFTFTPEERPA